MKISDLRFAPLGVLLGICELGRVGGRWIRSKQRYPQVRFGRGAIADDKCSFEEGVVIQEDVRLSNATIGGHSYVSERSILWNCRIGRYCSIGPEVRIGLGIHPTRNVISTYPGFYSTRRDVPISFHTGRGDPEHRMVSVGHDVWIGARVVVLDNVTISDGAIIGAGSIVTRDIPPYAVAVGAPARVTRVRFSESEIGILERVAWWNRDIEFCRANAPYFDDPRLFFEKVADDELLSTRGKR
jgi:acetyltransferase-like isoleucine patch superfamily enzyme